MTDDMNSNEQPYVASEQPASQENPYAQATPNPANPYVQAQQQMPQQPATGQAPQQPYVANPYAQQQYQQPQYPAGAVPQQPQYGQYYAQPAQPYYVSSKNKIVAALLAFFLGGLGIHNFYLGKTTPAIIQLVMSTIGWLLIIPPFIAGIWGFVEFILILVAKPGTSYHQDGQGLELQD